MCATAAVIRTRPVATVPRPEMEKTSRWVTNENMKRCAALTQRQITFDVHKEGLLKIT